MTYTPNTPQATDFISTTQPLIEANFQFLDTGIGVDHNFDVSDATVMYHNKASMPNLSTGETLPAGTAGMYYVLAGEAKFLNAAGVKCKLSSGVAASTGYQWIAQSLIQWGKTTASSSNIPVTFLLPFPTAVFNIQVTAIHDSSNPGTQFGFWVNSSGPTLTGFTIVNNSTHTFSYYWQAIGN